MNRKVIFFIFVSVLASLNLGSIRKAEDPIRDTQTNPILYEQKKEEEKGGKKGPLLYHVKNYPRETFFIDPPFETNKESFAKGGMSGEASVPAEAAGWWEEQSIVPPSETVSEPLPDAEKAQELESAERPAPATEAENASSGKGNDYWW